MPRPEDELKAEIEIRRKVLEEDIKKKEKEAGEKLNELLSKKGMEFCSRCDRKISSRLDWAGKCAYPGCDNILCNDCWIVNKHRYCKQHAEVVKGKEEKAEEKVFFKPEPEEEIELEPDLELIRTSKTEEEKTEKIKSLTAEYINWLEDRINKFGVPDWNQEEYFKDCKFNLEKVNNELKVLIYTKSLFKKKPKLQIIVRPLLPREEGDLNYLTAQLLKEIGKTKVYSLFILVGDACSLDTVNFVNGFVNKNFSLFLAEPKRGVLYYNIKNPVTLMYAYWFDQTKEPKQFKAILKSLADLVSGRFVISGEKVIKEFNFTPEQTSKILNSCKFLSPVKDTDSYLWKEE